MQCVTINGICKSAIQKGLMILIGIEETLGKPVRNEYNQPICILE